MSQPAQDVTNIVEMFDLSNTHRLPDYVNDADATQLQNADRSKLAADSYITDGDDLYPANTKAATWVSFARLSHKDLPDDRRKKIASFLLERADLFGTRNDCEAIITELNTQRKEACESDEKFPVRNLKEAKEALTFLIREMNEPFQTSRADRYELASKLSSYYPDSANVRIALGTHGCYDEDELLNRFENAQKTAAEDKQDAFKPFVQQAKVFMGGMALQNIAHKLAVEIDKAGLDIPCSPENFVATNSACDRIVLADGSVVSKFAVEACDEIKLSDAKIQSVKDLHLQERDMRSKIAAEDLDEAESHDLVQVLAEREPSGVFYRATSNVSVVGL